MKTTIRGKWIASQKNLARWRNQTYGDGYGTKMGQPNESIDFVASMLGKLNLGAGRLLDVGCAGGALRNSVFFPSNYDYFGIDPLKIDGCEYDFKFFAIPVEKAVTQFGQAFFDVVLIKDSIDYALDLSETFMSCRALLKPGGLFVISEGGRPLVWSKGCFIRLAKRGLLVNKLRLFLSAQSKKKIEVSDTYPNGKISTKAILASLRGNGFIISKTLHHNDRMTILATSLS